MTAPAIWTPLYGDWAENAKFRVIARRSGQPLAVVFAISAQMICPAWWSEPGRLKPEFPDLIAAALDLADDAMRAVCAAMQGLFLDGDRLRGWDSRRLSGRRDAAARPAAKSNAQRARESRERRKRALGELPLGPPRPPGSDSRHETD